MWTGNTRSQGGMWSALVVVGHPGHQSFPQMPFAQRNDPIEALPPQSPDQPFAKRVRLRTMHRRDDHLEAQVRQRSVQLSRKDPVCGELLISGQNQQIATHKSRSDRWRWLAPAQLRVQLNLG